MRMKLVHVISLCVATTAMLVRPALADGWHEQWVMEGDESAGDCFDVDITDWGYSTGSYVPCTHHWMQYIYRKKGSEVSDPAQSAGGPIFDGLDQSDWLLHLEVSLLASCGEMDAWCEMKVVKDYVTGVEGGCGSCRVENDNAVVLEDCGDLEELFADSEMRIKFAFEGDEEYGAQFLSLSDSCDSDSSSGATVERKFRARTTFSFFSDPESPPDDSDVDKVILRTSHFFRGIYADQLPDFVDLELRESSQEFSTDSGEAKWTVSFLAAVEVSAGSSVKARDVAQMMADGIPNQYLEYLVEGAGEGTLFYEIRNVVFRGGGR